jgi:hypothetical protein
MVGASGALGTAPSPSLITFQDDFNGTDLDSSKWSTGATGSGSIGSSGDSLRVDTAVADEAFGRPNIKIRPPADGWVTDFDFRLDSSSPAGDYFIIYASYAPHASGWPGVGSPIDIEMGLGATVYNSPDTVDIDVATPNGGSGGGAIDANLAWDTWYHFTIHRTYAGGNVDVYIDNVLKGSYTSGNQAAVLGSVQIGDVSVGNFVGAADWDNFVIGTIPEPASLSLILFAGLLLRGLKSRKS